VVKYDGRLKMYEMDPNGGLVTLYLVVYLKFDDSAKKITHVLTIRNIHNIY